jgi:polyphosphate kinase 2 (PPK2 family)
MPKRPVRQALRVDPRTDPVDLKAIGTRPERSLSKKKALASFASDQARLATLQERLYAQQTNGLLLVLQGMDTSGKDGTIKHVIGGVNPQGIRVVSFKKPTPVELRHHFLWRIRRQLPPPGLMAIFNRSQHEDVLVVRVHNLVPESEWSTRYEQINRFERQVVQAGIAIVKVFLHISHAEQRR